MRHPVGISDIGNDNLKLLKTILTITGSDSTGGSGVQAD
ncbi:MAG: thiamine-phosphate pyrophosphorylase, partial [Prevotella denticola]